MNDSSQICFTYHRTCLEIHTNISEIDDNYSKIMLLSEVSTYQNFILLKSKDVKNNTLECFDHIFDIDAHPNKDAV
jgi:hypothetical protein